MVMIFIKPKAMEILLGSIFVVFKYKHVNCMKVEQTGLNTDHTGQVGTQTQITQDRSENRHRSHMTGRNTYTDHTGQV